MSADARLFSVHDGPLTIEDGLWIMEYGRAMGVGQWHGRQTTHNGHGQWAMGYGQWGTGDKRQSTDGERQAVRQGVTDDRSVPIRRPLKRLGHHPISPTRIRGAESQIPRRAPTI
jgi:hypothetical protein